MNAMQAFNYEGNEVRTVMKDGEPCWVLADVCQVLGIQNNRNAARRLDDDEKNTVHLAGGIRGNPNMTIINESGLYKVILRSDKPEAKKFTRWVTHEVLPTLRKTGTYSMPGAAQPFTMEQMAQFAAAVAAQVVTQIVPVIISTVKEVAQPVEPARPVPWERVWNSNSHPGPRKDIVTRPPATKGTLRIETFPLDIVRAVDSMMEQMMEEQALNFSEIARYCTGQGYTISSPSVRRYYDKHFNRH